MKPRFYLEKSCQGASEEASVREALKTFSGVISEQAKWADIPAHGDPDLMDALDKQAKAIDSRTKLLRADLHEALRRSYAEAGYQLVVGSFESGGAITTATEVLLYEVNGKAYAWDGALPKVVPPASSPASTGGIGAGAWVDRTDVTLRSELAAPGGVSLIGACSSVTQLRTIEPTGEGQRINLASYYDDWAALVDGEPKYGGQFWHDANDVTTPDDGYKCFVTAGGKRWKRVKGVYSVGHAGAREDVSFDSTVQIQAAINATKEGEELQFVGGPFKFNQVECTKSIVLTGDARLVHNGFRIKTSNFTSKLSGKQQCWQYQSSSRAFFMRAYEDGVNYSTINILFNTFSGFFYCTDFRAIEYSAAPGDPLNRTVKGVTTVGCTSIAPPGVPAGHFQHTGITNAKCIGCSAYGGINATSYNFINGNGFIIVQGCYEEGNTYGALEIENNRVSWAVVSGCAFDKQLWIDDTSNVSITGCVVADRIFITAQSNDTDNITISGVTCTRLSVSKFGTSPTGRHKSVRATGCTFTGEAGAADVFSDDSVDSLTLESSSLNGDHTSAMSIERHSGCDHLLRNNRSRTQRMLSISGSDGRLIEYGNDKMTISGQSDSKHISNMMVPSPAYLDLPGKYLHGTKYTGSIAPLGTAGVSLPIPNSGSQAFRGVSVWVLIRDPATNNTSSYRVDGIYKVVGASIQLTFGTPYSAFGGDTASITLTNNASVADSINILVTNSHATKTLQVTVMPEVSSRFGAEE